MKPGQPIQPSQSSELEENQPTDEDLREVRVIAESSARYYGARTHEIDEVVQLTLIKVWEQWNSDHMVRARNRRGLRWAAYIRRVAKHTHLDQVRSHGRRLQRDTRAAGLKAPTTARPGTQRQSDNNAVDEMEAIIGREFATDLFDQLPERQRVVATLIFIEELTPAEIGERFDWDPQAVRKSLRAAKAKLLVMLGEMLDQPDTEGDAEDA